MQERAIEGAWNGTYNSTAPGKDWTSSWKKLA